MKKILKIILFLIVLFAILVVLFYNNPSVVGGSFGLSKQKWNYAGFDINSNPLGAKVYLDGKDTGLTTPASLRDIPLGAHTLTLTKTGYNTATKKITLKTRAWNVPVSMNLKKK